jgi:molecular chaperone GrpE
MGKRREKRKQAEEAVPSPEVEARPAEAAEEAPLTEPEVEGGGDTVVATPEAAALEQLAAELDLQSERYLRLAAEFDNFRKRMVRERSETSSRAQAHIVSSILESLDDLSRVAHLDPASATVEDVVSGVELVERKLLRELGSQGLTRIGAAGEPFNPNDHEAVATTPATTDGQEDTVAAVFQVGYRLGNTLVRPARVQVFVESQMDGQPQG